MPRLHLLLLLLFCGVLLPTLAEETLQGQGTAVVVGADGYLLTCASTVRDAGKIVATVAGTPYPATVVKTDTTRDLALLKVEAAGLTALALIEVETVRRGQSGRMVGYPTAPFKGSSLKSVQLWYNLVTEPDTPAYIQVYTYGRQVGECDGHLLMSERGELAGLVRSTLIEKSLGYAIPAMPTPEIKAFLVANGVTPLAAKTSGGRLDDAAFQQQVAPAIVPLTLYASPTSRQRITPKDGAVLVLVPAGDFTMGSPDGEGNPDEHPRRTVTLDGFWIYKYEVTVGQYRAFCTATQRALPSLPEWARDDYPMMNVTWQEAAAYAAWAGGTLPTEAQWEKAARGTDGRRYPWGTPSPGAYQDVRCVSGMYGRSSAQPVGSMGNGASPYGAQDMAGNVWEWCQDRYAAAPARNPRGPETGNDRVIRGGSWVDTFFEDFRCAARDHLAPEMHNYFVGFRCVLPAP